MGFVVPVVPAPVEVQRRRIDTMWRRVGRLGASSSLAVPLLIADQWLARLTVTPTIGMRSLNMPCGWGCFFAGPAAAYNAQVLSGARDTAEQLQRAEQPHGDQSSDRHDVGSFRQTADAAFDQLKQISQTENRKLYEVARGIGE